jgi:two-component sensor histidine kinase
VTWGEGRRLDARVEAIEVPTDIALPLALIVTELVTNAQKHAYDEGAPGVIAMALERTAGGLRLSVEDDGHGLAPGAGGGFGTALVEALVQQVQGELVHAPRQRGTRIEITVPLTRRGGAPAATPLGG